MPRLNKPLVPATHENIVPLKCEYREEMRGFVLSGGIPGPVKQLLDKKGKVIGHDGSVVWLVPEIYWHSISNLHKRYPELPALRSALWVFKEKTQRYVEMVKPSEPLYNSTMTTRNGTTLRDYQTEGVRALLKGSLLLADDMGTGKTLMMLYAFDRLNSQRGGIGKYRLLVFTPNEEVADDWINEGVFKHIGQGYCCKLIRSRANLKGFADVTLIPYSKIWRTDYAEYLRRLCLQPNTILVLDEGHLCSAITSHQHKSAYEYAQLCERTWIATGTECRDPSQYYGVYRIARALPGNHTTERAWVSHFRNRSGYGWDADKLGQLRVLRKSFAIRRTKQDVCKELPPYTAIKVPCPMHPIQAELYFPMEKEKECEVQAEYGKKELTEKQFLTVYLRLMQITSHPLNIEETRVGITPKLEAILDILAGAGEQRVLIWSNWPKTIDHLAVEIHNRMPDLTIGVAHGGIDKEVRRVTKQRAQAGEVDLLIANPKLWATGINLQPFSIMIRYDHHPSSEKWEQARDRTHRIGQQLPVTDYVLFHPNTVEVRILRWLMEKKRLSTLITGG